MESKRNSVVLFYVHGGGLENCFLESVVGALAYDAGHERRICDVRSVEGLYVADNRDRAGRTFMRYRLCDQCRAVIHNGQELDGGKRLHCNECNRDVTDPLYPEWLWSMDTDISLQSYDVLDQLIACADPVERPIMSALYFGYMNNNNIVPVWYGRDPLDGRIVNLTKFGSGVQQVGVVGMGCCVIHRSVFEKFGTRYAKSGWLYFGHDRAPWQPEADVWNDITAFGEDNCFCHRCNELGIPIHGNGSIVVQHRKKRYEDLQTFLSTFAQGKVDTDEKGTSVRLRRTADEKNMAGTVQGVVEPRDGGQVSGLQAEHNGGPQRASIYVGGR